MATLNKKLKNMKKTILPFALFITLGLIFTSCNETKKSESEVKEKTEVKEVTKTSKSSEIAMAEYQCPMQCEGDKTYDKPGTCPKCKMDLKKAEASHDADNDKDKMLEEENHDNHDH